SLARAGRAEKAIIGPDQRTWLDRLERELGNLRAALEWFFQTNQASYALRLAAALWFFWDMRGHLREGQRWLEAALDMVGVSDGSERAAALNASGWLALVQHGSYAQAITTSNRLATCRAGSRTRRGSYVRRDFLAWPW